MSHEITTWNLFFSRKSGYFLKCFLPLKSGLTSKIRAVLWYLGCHLIPWMSSEICMAVLWNLHGCPLKSGLSSEIWAVLWNLDCPLKSSFPLKYFFPLKCALFFPSLNCLLFISFSSVSFTCWFLFFRNFLYFIYIYFYTLSRPFTCFECLLAISPGWQYCRKLASFLKKLPNFILQSFIEFTLGTRLNGGEECLSSFKKTTRTNIFLLVKPCPHSWAQ